MKDLLMAILCLLLTITTQAQDTTTTKQSKKQKNMELLEEQEEPLRSKNGRLILPEKGNLGLSVNVIPFLHWFGNTFNNNASNLYASSGRFFNILGSSVIMGRHMLSNSTSIRLALGFRTNTTQNSRAYSTQLEDTWTRTAGAYVLNIGYEKRIGKGRLKGYYGIDFIAGFRNEAQQYTYINSYSDTNPTPASTNWNNNVISVNRRVLEEKPRISLSAGIRPFVGVEYFFAPKISVGAEFGGSVLYTGTFKSQVDIETYVSGAIIISEVIVGSSSQFSAYIDSMGGAIFMNFYF